VAIRFSKDVFYLEFPRLHLKRRSKSRAPSFVHKTILTCVSSFLKPASDSRIILFRQSMELLTGWFCMSMSSPVIDFRVIESTVTSLAFLILGNCLQQVHPTEIRP